MLVEQSGYWIDYGEKYRQSKLRLVKTPKSVYELN